MLLLNVVVEGVAGVNNLLLSGVTDTIAGDALLLNSVADNVSITVPPSLGTVIKNNISCEGGTPI